MIPKFVIPFLFVFVLVSTDGQELETNGIKKIASENIATILEPEFTTNEKSEISDEKVKIQLYYETLCGDCLNFAQTFVNNVVQLQGYLDVFEYPYGFAKVEQNGTITCQHGPEECYGNKLHACAIDYFGNITTAVIFNGCMMTGDKMSDDAAADECGLHLGVESEPIKSCAKGPKGEELLKFYGDETRKVHFEECPAVLINGVVGRLDRFRLEVCASFKNPPAPCRR